MAVYLWSDLHLDYGENLETLESLNSEQYQQDSILIAGDVTHNIALIRSCFRTLKQTFKYVFFTPGNHDLWLHKKDFSCSIKKFEYLQTLCQELNIITTATLLNEESEPVWIVPLLSWYCKPEWGEESLYIPKEGEDPSLKMWADNYRLNWPSLAEKDTPDKYFLRLNQQYFQGLYKEKVISFSHFLPNKAIIFPDNREREYIPRYANDPFPSFNFTRVAGSSALEQQLSILKPTLHAYGHQHRNKFTSIRGIHYVSHCMGYPTETPIGPTGNKRLPLRIWPR
jgi:Calcineurin-like phosphoesterase